MGQFCMAYFLAESKTSLGKTETYNACDIEFFIGAFGLGDDLATIAHSPQIRPEPWPFQSAVDPSPNPRSK